MMPLEVPKARKLFFLIIAGITAIVMAAAPFSKVSVDVCSFYPLFYFIAVLGAGAVYCHYRGMSGFGIGFEIIGCGLFITLPVLAMTYFVIGFGFPLADARLDAMDRALGFDWLAYIRFVDSRPLLSTLLFDAYRSISYQLLLIPVLLILAGRPQRAFAMMAGYATLCMLASLIATFFPALGTYAYYGMTEASVANINPFFALSPVPDFIAVHGQAAYTLTLSSASGLICFPSVHAGVACLCAWACWDLRWARYPALVLNVAMTAAAISHANHYFVDIVAGLGNASLTIALMTGLFLRRPLFRSPATSPAAASG
jgi:hypothetical protein